jgi:nucleotide-binding universal stress UspA family protein
MPRADEHGRPWRSTAPAVTPQVLLVTAADREPDEALWRAHELAAAVEGSLTILRVAPPLLGSNVLFPQHHLEQALAEARLSAEIVGHTRAWCARVLDEPVPSRHLLVRIGDLAVEAENVASRLAAVLVVLPPDEACHDDLAVTVVRDLEIPVLVARAMRPGAAVVAGTDLLRDGYPVVRQGAVLAAQLHGPLTCVHNVPPMTNAGLARSMPQPPPAPTSAELEAWQHRLDTLVHEVVADSDSVVTNRSSTADAILEVARARDADVVVVGAHARSWLDRLVGDSVASRVVERADRSVLVVPTPSRRRGGARPSPS